MTNAEERIELLALQLKCSHEAALALHADRDLPAAAAWVQAAEELARQYDELPPRGCPEVS